MDTPPAAGPALPMNSPELIDKLLTTTTLWFVVGLRDNPQRAAYGVARVLLDHGMDVVPIHPRAQQVHGRRGYPSIAAAAAELGAPDVVDVFLRPDLVDPIVDEAIAAQAGALWFQLGVIAPAAAERASAAGLEIVMDRCPAIELPRLGR